MCFGERRSICSLWQAPPQTQTAGAGRFLPWSPGAIFVAGICTQLSAQNCPADAAAALQAGASRRPVRSQSIWRPEAREDGRAAGWPARGGSRGSRSSSRGSFARVAGASAARRYACARRLMCFWQAAHAHEALGPRRHSIDWLDGLARWLAGLREEDTTFALFARKPPPFVRSFVLSFACSRANTRARVSPAPLTVGGRKRKQTRA